MALPTTQNTFDNKMPGLWEEVATGGSLPVDDTFFYVDETLVDCMGENIYTSGFATGTSNWSSGLATGTDAWS